MARLSKQKYIKNIQYRINVTTGSDIGLHDKSNKTYFHIEVEDNDVTLYSGKRILLFGENGLSFWVRYWKFEIRKENSNETYLENFVTREDNQKTLPDGTYRYYTQILVEYDNEALSETDAISRIISEASNPQPNVLDREGLADNFMQPLENAGGGKRGLIEPDDLAKLRGLKRDVMFWNRDNTSITDNEHFTVCVLKLDNTEPIESVDVRLSSTLINAAFTVHISKIYETIKSSPIYNVADLADLRPRDFNGAITVDYFDARLENKSGLLYANPHVTVKAQIEQYANSNDFFLRVVCKVVLNDYSKGNPESNQTGLYQAVVSLGAKSIESLSYFNKSIKKNSATVTPQTTLPIYFFHPSYRMQNDENSSDLVRELENTEYADNGIAVIDEYTLGYTSGRRVSIPRRSESKLLPQIIMGSSDLNQFTTDGYFWSLGDKKGDNSIKHTPLRNNVEITDAFRLEVQTVDGFDHNALLYRPLYEQLYGITAADFAFVSKVVFQRLISFSAVNEVITDYGDGNRNVEKMDAPHIYERLFINGAWTVWNEVGRAAHSHFLESLKESDNSLHLTKGLLEQITGAVGAISDTPFDTKLYANYNELLSGLGNFKVGATKEGGIYQRINGTTIRLDIGGLENYTADDSDDGSGAGSISKKLYESLKNAQFLKNVGEDDFQALVFWKNDVTYGITNKDYYDIVHRTGATNVLCGTNSIAFGFKGTAAFQENSIAIGSNVKANSNSAIIIGSDIDAGTNGKIFIGNNLSQSATFPLRYVIGQYNAEPVLSNAAFVIANGEETNHKNIFELSSDGAIGIDRIVKITGSETNKDKLAFGADGNLIDTEVFATKESVEELDRNKVDIGSNFVIRFISSDGVPYDMVAATDPAIEIISIPNSKNTRLMYSPEHYLIFPEGIRIDFLEKENENVNEDETEIQESYIRILIPASITINGKTLIFEINANEPADNDYDEFGNVRIDFEYYPLLNFKELDYDIDESKIDSNAINRIVTVDLNTTWCTFNKGDKFQYEPDGE